MNYECQGIGIDATCGTPAYISIGSFGVDKNGNAVDKKVWLCEKHYDEYIGFWRKKLEEKK